MKNSGFRKLNMEMERQPIINQRPWLVAGLLLVLLLLLMTAWAYFKNTSAKEVALNTTNKP